MIWTFFILLFGSAFAAVILAEVWEQVDERRAERKHHKEGSRRE